MVFNATVNNISAISWRSVLLGEETGVPGKSHRAVSSTPRNEGNSIDTDCITHRQSLQL